MIGPIPQLIGESTLLPGAEKQVPCLSRARLCAIKCLPVPKSYQPGSGDFLFCDAHELLYPDTVMRVGTAQS